MDGHVTPVGMQADLDAWKQSGIGVGIYLEINIGVPQGPGTYMSDAWPQTVAAPR